MVSSPSVCETTQSRYLENGATCSYNNFLLLYVRAIYTSREAVSQGIHAFFSTWRDTVAGDQLIEVPLCVCSCWWCSPKYSSESVTAWHLPPDAELAHGCEFLSRYLWLENHHHGCLHLTVEQTLFKGKWKRGILISIGSFTRVRELSFAYLDLRTVGRLTSCAEPKTLWLRLKPPTIKCCITPIKC